MKPRPTLHVSLEEVEHFIKLVVRLNEEVDDADLIPAKELTNKIIEVSENIPNGTRAMAAVAYLFILINSLKEHKGPKDWSIN